MKKFLLIGLSIVLLVSLIACDFYHEEKELENLETRKEYLLVRGYIDPVEEKIEFRPFTTFNYSESIAEEFMPEPGEFILRVLDGEDNKIKDIPFSLRTTGNPMDGATFSIPVALDTGVRKVQFIYEEEILASKSASPNKPEVSIIHPRGGEVFEEGYIDINWTGEDPDGNELIYTVSYSSDGGRNWDVVGSGMTRRYFKLNTDNIRSGDEGVIRVRATDGFNTAEDISGLFTVQESTKPPNVFISVPQDGYEFNQRSGLRLSGNAHDVDWTPIEDDNYEWSSDIQGHLGYGRNLELPGSTLTVGEHIITLKVTNSKGISNEESIRVRPTSPSISRTVS